MSGRAVCFLHRGCDLTDDTRAPSILQEELEFASPAFLEPAAAPPVAKVAIAPEGGHGALSEVGGGRVGGISSDAESRSRCPGVQYRRISPRSPALALERWK